MNDRPMTRFTRKTPITPEESEHNRGVIGRTMREIPPKNATPSDIRNVLWYALFDAAAPLIGERLSHETLARAVDMQLSQLLAGDMSRWLKLGAEAPDGTATPALTPPAWPIAVESPGAAALRAELEAWKAQQAGMPAV